MNGGIYISVNWHKIKYINNKTVRWKFTSDHGTPWKNIHLFTRSILKLQ